MQASGALSRLIAMNAKPAGSSSDIPPGGGVNVAADDNVLSAVVALSKSSPNAPVLMTRGPSGDFVPMSASSVVQKFTAFAAGLVGAGVEAGDRVAIFSHSSADWALLDYAIWQAGATGVTVYETSAADQVEWILSNSETRLVLVEDTERAELVESVRSRLPALERVIVMDDDGLRELVALGAGVDASVLDERAAGIAHSDVATLVYTSGTTGRPKGCVLTHLNLIWTVRQVIETLPSLLGPSKRMLTFLPLAHVLARVVQLAAITSGTVVGFGGGITTLLKDLADFRPTALVVVPRVLEKLHDGAAQQAGTGIKRKMFDAADVAARAMGVHIIDRTTPSFVDKAKHQVFDKAVYSTIRGAVGGELRHVISGGAPLNEDLGRFFAGVGLEVLEGYGLTETTGPATVHRPGASKPGTVGPPLPGVGVRIADTGEIQLAGNLVFSGYWKNDEATVTVFDGEWFRTGDIGEIDRHGHVAITGRIKDLIVTAGGKNIAPAPLEGAVSAHPLVSHAVVVGDNRKFISSLITLDVQTLGAWANEHGRQASSPGHLVEELAKDAELREELQRAIDAANGLVSRAEGIREFRVLPSDFTVASGELTPTMKVRRSIVLDRYAELVDRIYS